jgi:hypothetical protein
MGTLFCPVHLDLVRNQQFYAIATHQPGACDFKWEIARCWKCYGPFAEEDTSASCSACGAKRYLDACPRNPEHGFLVPMPEDLLFGEELGPEPALRTEGLAELDLSPVASTWSLFGADANGRPLISEMYLVLDRDGVKDEGEQAFWLDLWCAMTSERLTVAAERQESQRREMEQRGRDR